MRHLRPITIITLILGLTLLTACTEPATDETAAIMSESTGPIFESEEPVYEPLAPAPGMQKDHTAPQFVGGGASPFDAMGLGAHTAANESPGQVASLDDELFPEYKGGDLFAGKYDLIKNSDGTVTYQGHTYKRNTYVKAVLIMGIDRAGLINETETSFGGQADGIFLVAHDTARDHLKLLMVPRNTVTQIDIIDADGNVTERQQDFLSLAYAYGDGRHQSALNTVHAAEETFAGLKIDHYVALDRSLIGKAADLLGGITVTIPSDELEKVNPKWTKGTRVTLLGDDAERFVRYRDLNVYGSPVLRMDQHREFITAFYRTAQQKSHVDSGILTRLYDQAQDYLVTDLDKAGILTLCANALKDGAFSAEDISEIGGQRMTGTYTEIYLDYGKFIPLILDLFYREVKQ